MGFANEVATMDGGKIRLCLSPNPSHLEAVNPVVEGFVRARQRLLKDEDRARVIPLLMHGDAFDWIENFFPDALQAAAVRLAKQAPGSL